MLLTRSRSSAASPPTSGCRPEWQVARAATFLIDPQGRLVKHYVDVDAKGHSNAVLNDIKALRQQTN